MSDVFVPLLIKTKVAGDVSVNINTGQSVGVTGTFYQTTQPVSLAVAPTTPVTGTFYQTTQPVSLAVAPTTPVTGTFYQTTQPVSMATAPTTPVTGTFYQATQPVSMATAPTTPVTGTFYQATQPVSGTFYQATQPVSLAANQSVNFAQLNGVSPAVGSGASNTGTQRMILATDQATIPVSQGLSFTTVDSGMLTSASLAAGASVTLSGAISTSGIGKLFEFTAASSVALKVVLQSYNGTTATVKRVFFTLANTPLLYEPVRYDANTFTGAAGACFQLVITNVDNANAADVYGSITHTI